MFSPTAQRRIILEADTIGIQITSLRAFISYIELLYNINTASKDGEH